MKADELERIARKYEVLVALRLERELAEEAGLDAFEQDESVRRRERMRALAAEFPGALRELDALSMAELRARVALAHRALAGEPVAPVLVVAIAFHGAMRDSLAARADGGRGSLALVWERVAWETGLAAGEAERLLFGSSRR